MCKSVYILQISSRAFKGIFSCKIRRRYSRERASQSLPKISQTLEKNRTNIGEVPGGAWPRRALRAHADHGDPRQGQLSLQKCACFLKFCQCRLSPIDSVSTKTELCSCLGESARAIRSAERRDGCESAVRGLLLSYGLAVRNADV